MIEYEGVIEINGEIDEELTRSTYPAMRKKLDKLKLLQLSDHELLIEILQELKDLKKIIKKV